jgi:hypothetical protein
VLEQARALARRILARDALDDSARIDWLYTLLYGRPPSEEERRIGLDSLMRTAGSAASAESPETAWAAYCQVLLCANEFIYID